MEGLGGGYPSFLTHLCDKVRVGCLPLFLPLPPHTLLSDGCRPSVTAQRHVLHTRPHGRQEDGGTDGGVATGRRVCCCRRSRVPALRLDPSSRWSLWSRQHQRHKSHTHTYNILTSLCPVFQPADTLLWKVISEKKKTMFAEKSAADLEMNFCSRDGFGKIKQQNVSLTSEMSEQQLPPGEGAQVTW